MWPSYVLVQVTTSKKAETGSKEPKIYSDLEFAETNSMGGG